MISKTQRHPRSFKRNGGKCAKPQCSRILIRSLRKRVRYATFVLTRILGLALLGSARLSHFLAHNPSRCALFVVRSKFDSQVSFLDHEAGTITSVLFHPFENILVSSDDQDIVSVWNWSDNTKLNTFSNGARVTSMKLVNDNHQQVMLLTGSDDGVVRCWRNFTQATGALELASSWRALNDLSSNGRVRGAGLVLHWCQADGWLMASGDVPIIRVWDMEKDLSIQDIPTGGESCVTQIVQDKTGNSRLFVVGCGDGSLRAFDCRAPPRFMLVQNFNEHKNWVVNVDIPTLTKNRIISGSVGGDVKIWDIRSPNSQAYVIDDRQVRVR